MVLAAISAMLGACASFQGVPDKITIDSNPPGARVFASNLDIGATPVTINVDEVFPLRWTTPTKEDHAPTSGGLSEDEPTGFAIYRRLGTLTFRKPGCDTLDMRVDSQALTRNISVNLKCDPNYQPPAAPVAAPPATAGEPTIEQRLKQLEALKDKGTISDDEYRRQRERILNQL